MDLVKQYRKNNAEMAKTLNIRKQANTALNIEIQNLRFEMMQQKQRFIAINSENMQLNIELNSLKSQNAELKRKLEESDQMISDLRRMFIDAFGFSTANYCKLMNSLGISMTNYDTNAETETTTTIPATDPFELSTKLHRFSDEVNSISQEYQSIENEPTSSDGDDGASVIMEVLPSCIDLCPKIEIIKVEQQLSDDSITEPSTCIDLSDISFDTVVGLCDEESTVDDTHVNSEQNRKPIIPTVKITKFEDDAAVYEPKRSLSNSFLKVPERSSYKRKAEPSKAFDAKSPRLSSNGTPITEIKRSSTSLGKIHLYSVWFSSLIIEKQNKNN